MGALPQHRDVDEQLVGRRGSISSQQRHSKLVAHGFVSVYEPVHPLLHTAALAVRTTILHRGGLPATVGETKKTFPIPMIWTLIHWVIFLREGQALWQGNRKESCDGTPAHGGYIADIHCGGLPAKLLRRDVGKQEMAVLYKQIGGDQGVHAGALRDDGAIVAYAQDAIRGGTAVILAGKTGAYAPDKIEFSNM